MRQRRRWLAGAAIMAGGTPEREATVPTHPRSGSQALGFQNPSVPLGGTQSQGESDDGGWEARD